jgi:uncharacterized protein YuzE
MKIEYDNEIDALYIRLQEKYVDRTLEIVEGINIDLDASGKMIGIEVLDAATDILWPTFSIFQLKI